jgi:hypothetical protein
MDGLKHRLAIAQYYRLGSAASDATIIYAGQQDQGTAQRIGNNWSMISFGDGMEAVVDPTNTDNIYHATQNGTLYFSFDAGFTSWILLLRSIQRSMGDSIPNASLQSSFAAGRLDEVMKSMDGGSSWIPLTNMLSGGAAYTVFAAARQTATLFMQEQLQHYTAPRMEEIHGITFLRTAVCQ